MKNLLFTAVLNCNITTPGSSTEEAKPGKMSNLEIIFLMLNRGFHSPFNHTIQQMNYPLTITRVLF